MPVPHTINKLTALHDCNLGILTGFDLGFDYVLDPVLPWQQRWEGASLANMKTPGTSS